MIRKFILGVTVSSAIVLAGAGAAFADTNPSGTGQPTQSCGMQPSSPGQAALASGSVFNSSGVSGTVYAGNPGTPSLANGSSTAVSQYDVACFQVSH